MICWVSQSQWWQQESVWVLHLWQVLGYYDWDTLLTSYSYQVFVIYIYISCVSAPATILASSGHQDATSTWGMRGLWSHIHSSGSSSSWFLTCSMLWITIESTYPLHILIMSTSYIYKVLQHLPLWPGIIRMQPQPDIWVGVHPEATAMGSFFGGRSTKKASR